MTKLKLYGLYTAWGFVYLIATAIYLLLGSWLISGVFCITFTALQLLQLSLLCLGIRAAYEYLKA